MRDLRPAAIRYIALLVAITVVVTALAVSQVMLPSIGHLLLAATFAALAVVATSFPVHFGFKSKISLETSVLFAALLLFDPGIAIAIALVGSALGDLVTRRPTSELLFNAAQLALQTAAAALLLQSAGWQPTDPDFAQVSHIVAIGGAAGVMTILNVMAVVLMISVQSGLSPRSLLREVGSFDLLEELTQFGLGLLAAITIADYPWTLVIFGLLAYAVFRSSERQVQLRDQTIEALTRLADAIDLRDPYTANHSRRVGIYARELAISLNLSPDEIDVVERAARVHDIGKIIVDLAVLTKDGRLDDDDWVQLKQHPGTGADVLSRFPEFTLATAYVRHHHESLDGTGYPDGLRGDAIPLGARIIAVADSFDAMASARPYRRALPSDVVLAEFQKKRGVQWDAQVVDALLGLVDAGRITFPGSASTPQLYDRHGVLVPLPAAG